MRKTIVAVVVIALLLMSLATNALASSYLYFTGNCNVRSGPGLQYSILGSVNSGSILDYTGETCYDNRGIAWYSVPFGYGEGWVSSVYAQYTKYGGIATYSSGGSNNLGTTFCEPNDYDANIYVKATGINTNIRIGPGLYYAKIDVLHQGDWADFAGDVIYDNRGIAWYAIFWEGGYAWVSSVYTTLYYEP